MKKSPTVIVAFILLLVIAFTAAIVSVIRLTPSDPLAGSGQLVLVVSGTSASSKATLQMFNREGDEWKYVFSCPAVIGRSGMAWGRGLHKDGDMLEGDPVKSEGDGATPAGAFPLVHAYGYQPPYAVTIDFPYTQSYPGLICCDDPGSRHYTKIVDIREKGLDPENLPSHEVMLRDDDLYKYAILVGHNTWKPEKNAGSCIFIHLWGGPNGSTAGCTAISEENMLILLSELDADRNPVLVALTRKDYKRLRDTWGLPDVTF